MILGKIQCFNTMFLCFKREGLATEGLRMLGT